MASIQGPTSPKLATYVTYPPIIQGGMGVAISSWSLARAVAERGQMGVVSGTGIDTVMTRRLQVGDIGGHVRRALDHFPIPEIAEHIWERYFVAGGKPEDAPFKAKPVPSLKPHRNFTDLLVVANFVEVFLAKEGHPGPVGLNLLEKIQIPTIASLYGAMLAGVDYVIMGAGIPRAIPKILDQLSEGQPASMDINVVGAQSGDEPVRMTFDPNVYCGGIEKRPNFLAVVSSTMLGQLLAKRTDRPVDGFVIEGPTAGGHNAPPRGQVQLNERGEPIYGDKDIPDLEKFVEFGLPFWLAGSFAGRLKEAQSYGAQGVQVGTAFAFCEESGMRADLRQRVLDMVKDGTAEVFTDPLASPTGFPFKVVQEPTSIATESEYQKRGRICDLGYLREVYRKDDGSVGYRCASEPEDDYVDKGGEFTETCGRKCLCNGLLATAGFPQVRKDGAVEPHVITAGDDVVNLGKFFKNGSTSYTAADVIEYLLNT